MGVLNWFSKCAIFITAPTLCYFEIATKLFSKFVVKNFIVPLDIVSDEIQGSHANFGLYCST